MRLAFLRELNEAVANIRIAQNSPVRMSVCGDEINRNIHDCFIKPTKSLRDEIDYAAVISARPARTRRYKVGSRVRKRLTSAFDNDPR